MNCNCKWFETVLAVVIFVFAVWPELVGMVASKWIIAIAAVLLLIHAWSCRNCGMCSPKGEMKMSTMPRAPVKASKAKKKRR